jgi:hypothetical protein
MQASQLCSTFILGWKTGCLSDASKLLALHRAQCDGRRHINDVEIIDELRVKMQASTTDVLRARDSKG